MDKWDKRFMEIARTVAGWSSCTKSGRSVGAVVVRDKRILATGYNGAPEGIKPCTERDGCMRQKLGIPSGTRHELCYAVHAEQNAIAQGARMGIPLFGAAMYVTHSPCSICTKLIINAGIKRVMYAENYPDDFSLELLKEANITVEKYGG